MPIRTSGGGGSISGGINALFNGQRGITRIPSVGLNVGTTTLKQFLESLFFPFAPADDVLSCLDGYIFEVGVNKTIRLKSVITANGETVFNGGNLKNIYPDNIEIATRISNEDININHSFFPRQSEGGYLLKTFRAFDTFGNNGTPTEIPFNLITVNSCYPYLYGMSAIDYSSSTIGFYKDMTKIVKSEANSTAVYMNSPTELKYAYFAFPLTYDSLTSILFNNILDVIGAWSLIATANVTSEDLDENWTSMYKIYRSNAKFNSDNLPYIFNQ